MLTATLTLALALATSDTISPTCDDGYKRAIEAWTSYEGNGLFWHGDVSWQLPRFDESYNLDLYCITDERGRVTEVLGVHEFTGPFERPTGQRNSRWVLDLIVGGTAGRKCDPSGRFLVCASDTYCPDPAGLPVAESHCGIGAWRDVALGGVVRRATGRSSATLRIPRDYRPEFMAPGPDKDKVLALLGMAIAQEINDMGWRKLYPGDKVDVLVEDFEENPPWVNVIYWHPPWGRMERMMSVDLTAGKASFERGAYMGYTPNSAAMTEEDSMSEHDRRRIRENSIHLMVPLTSDLDKAQGRCGGGASLGDKRRDR